MKMLHVYALVVPLLVAFANVQATSKPQHATYSKNEVLVKIEDFFGEGAEGLAEVVEKAFSEHGQPNGYIAGDEASAALGVGVRYGKGHLHMAGGHNRKIYWQGPSIGFDAGANASKVFMLIYTRDSVESLYQRHPGVEGSAYFVGGVGINYLRSGNTVIVPIRLGAGWRQGVNIGYLDFTRKASINPL